MPAVSLVKRKPEPKMWHGDLDELHRAVATGMACSVCWGNRIITTFFFHNLSCIWTKSS